MKVVRADRNVHIITLLSYSRSYFLVVVRPAVITVESLPRAFSTVILEVFIDKGLNKAFSMSVSNELWIIISYNMSGMEGCHSVIIYFSVHQKKNQPFRGIF